MPHPSRSLEQKTFMRNRKTLVIVVIFVVLGIGLLLYSRHSQIPQGKYDTFAQCLKNKGATFYGAFWCPHCQNQKSMFGSSVDLLPYVECSTPDGQGQLQTCKDKNVTGYPTWVFPDGSRQSGEVSLEQLAQKTGCELPK